MSSKRKTSHPVTESIKRRRMSEGRSILALMPLEIRNVVLGFAANHRQKFAAVLAELIKVVHGHRQCSSCNGFACWDGCDDDGCIVQDCCSCGIDLCDDCARGDEHDASWYTCENCCETICGGCLHRCSCDSPSPFYDNNCSGCYDN